MTAGTYIEKVIGGFELDWEDTPMLTVKQKYNTKNFDHASLSFASPSNRHIDPAFVTTIKVTQIR
jgi:hypothetical protein